MKGDAMREKHSGSSIAVTVVVVLLLLPLLYALSIGPVAWLIDHKLITEESNSFLIALYWPLQVAADLSPAFERTITWYIRLWAE